MSPELALILVMLLIAVAAAATTAWVVQRKREKQRNAYIDYIRERNIQDKQDYKNNFRGFRK